jgi:hypothetical protein
MLQLNIAGGEPVFVWALSDAMDDTAEQIERAVGNYVTVERRETGFMVTPLTATPTHPGSDAA